MKEYASQLFVAFSGYSPGFKIDPESESESESESDPESESESESDPN